MGDTSASSGHGGLEVQAALTVVAEDDGGVEDGVSLFAIVMVALLFLLVLGLHVLGSYFRLGVVVVFNNFPCRLGGL